MTELLELVVITTGISYKNVSATVALLNDGATIPFISRYRKEKTGGLDETRIEIIKKEYERFAEIKERKLSIISSVEKQGKLTDEFLKHLNSTWDINEIEDLYLPYKPKRKTRASVAREKGLEPLAEAIMKQDPRFDVFKFAESFVNEQVKDVDDAIKGAKDIIAEIVSEDKQARERIRKIFAQTAVISSRVIKSKETEAEKYKDYFEFSQKLDNCPSHRILAIMRANRESLLRVDISPDRNLALKSLNYLFVKGKGQSSLIVAEVLEDAYDRLLKPSIENEFFNEAKQKADIQAIEVFASNLRQLLLEPPLGRKRVMGIDPGYRTGCKVVCLDETGNLLHNETIYPHKPQEEIALAAKKISTLVNTYKIEAIAIGNGTASRETEYFIKKIHFDRDVKVYVVSEDGASVYSASSIAREEFPQYDVTVRGAVSIARRLMDPLAELVKIDPKSIGVGQYQHDVDQKMLKESLDRVVESCVNTVGVNLNTASKHLLTYVSGLGPVLAKNIVEYRKAKGYFKSRKELLQVPRLGEKAYEQCAGFLRIPESDNPLDNSAVHPEAYGIVEKIAKNLGVKINELISNRDLISKINLHDYIDENFGLPTLQDIVSELEKPGRDPRKQVKVLEFDKSIYKIEDLKEGMILPGIVTNITNFGAFVDIGIKENGLIHISQITEQFISSPSELLKLHQHVKVKILSVDIERKRIQLSMKEVQQ